VGANPADHGSAGSRQSEELLKPTCTRDDYLVAYALVGGADYLVTGDADLLVLARVGEVKIVTPPGCSSRGFEPRVSRCRCGW